MYYVFNNSIKKTESKVFQATWAGSRLKYEPFWWDAKPLIEPIPQFSFELDGEIRPDNYWTGTEINLYSQKLVDLLAQTGVKFETFPAICLDRQTQKPVETDYKVFHLLEKLPALDTAKSERSSWPLPETKRLVLTDACLHRKTQLFRVEEQANLVLMHENLKSTLEAFGITGCIFTPYQEYQSLLANIVTFEE